MGPDPPPFEATTRRRGLLEEELSYAINGAFFEVYNELGFGYLESIYASAMAIVLKRRGLVVEREVPVTIQFKGIEVGKHRLDMLVDGRVIIEIKSTERLADHAKRQLRN